MRTTFVTHILRDGNNTGIEVPPDNLAELGTSKRPPVIVDVNGYTFRSTVAVMGGKFLIGFAKEHREKSGLAGGDEVTVTLTVDDAPRTVEIPAELRAALEEHGLLARFEALAFTHRKEHCRYVAEAKQEATRTRRVQKVIDML